VLTPDTNPLYANSFGDLAWLTMLAVEVKDSPLSASEPPKKKFKEQKAGLVLSHDPLTMLEAVHDPLTNRLEFMAFTDGVSPYRLDEHVIDETKSIIPPLAFLSTMETGLVALPSGVSPYGDQKQLISDIRSFLHRYVDIPSEQEEFIAHYILMTWVYDKFTAIPYLRFLGEPQTGKSRLLQVAGHLSYHATFAGGSTSAAGMFRLADKFHGTLIIDEADYKATDQWSDVVKILNTGYMRGNPIVRIEQGPYGMKVKSYSAYGPKIIANRSRFSDPALETRCITFETRERKLRADVPRQLPAQFFDEARELRNKLLQWRFDNFASIVPDESKLLELDPRLTQIGTPIYSVSRDEVFRERLIDYLKQYADEQRADKPQAIVVEALTRLRTGTDDTFLVKQVTTRVNEVELEYGADERMSAKKVGLLLHSLGFDKRRTKKGYQIIVETDRLEELQQKYTRPGERVNVVREG
jgi:hypothetical protein